MGVHGVGSDGLPGAPLAPAATLRIFVFAPEGEGSLLVWPRLIVIGSFGARLCAPAAQRGILRYTQISVYMFNVNDCNISSSE